MNEIAIRSSLVTYNCSLYPPTDFFHPYPNRDSTTKASHSLYHLHTKQTSYYKTNHPHLIKILVIHNHPLTRPEFKLV